MDLNLILRWVVTISCFSLMLQVLLVRRNWGWLGTTLGILMAMGIVSYLSPDYSGIVGGILWLILILFPVIGLRRIHHFIDQERFQSARRLASVLAWLHPADGWWEQPQFLYALQLLQTGEKARAQSILDQKLHRSNYYYIAKALQFQMESRWVDYLYWLRSETSEFLLWQNPTLVIVYLRALGEVGDLNGLLWVVKSYEPKLQRLGNAYQIHLARLYVLAFSGEMEAVKGLFASTLSVYPQNIKAFWLATAEMAAGYNEAGRNRLFHIEDKTISLENAIARRLTYPPSRAIDVLKAESISILEHLKQNLRQEINYGSAISITPTTAYFTYGLIAMNLFIFMVTLTQGGSQDIETLTRFGAAVPDQIFSQQPWRVITANFLHFGPAHLITNLLGLWILGPYVEFYVGWLRYLIIYLGSGIGAISLFASFAMLLGDGNEILVGASAAIMGLMGSTLIILWQGWRKDQSRIAQEKLRLVILIIILQLSFDVTVPNVSFLGHFFGLLVGILLTIIILSWRKQQAPG